MKKIMILICVLMLFLTGCKSTEQPPFAQEDFYDIAGEKTVIYHGEHTFPLSFTVDGKQQIANGTYWYYELADDYSRTWEDKFYTYDPKRLELNGNRSYTNLGKKQCYATNGDWPLFLNPVHTEYTASNQEKVDPILRNLTKQQLNHNNIEATPLVTDVWVCDLNGDGTLETLFKACNCADVKEEPAVKYCFLAYSKEDACQVIYSSFRPEGGATPETLKPLVCDLEGDGNREIIVYQQGDYKSFGVYGYQDGNISKKYEILF